MKPPIAYYGGKMTLAERIVAMLPSHGHYVEPFAGSLSVLLAKKPAAMETVNDLDGDLVTFWRVLRERPQELAEVALLTPHARTEFLAARDLDGAPDDLERARRVWVLLTQGRTGSLRNTGWRSCRNPGGRFVSIPDELRGLIDRMLPAAERLSGVTIECRDALDVIGDYGKHKDVLIYADPPYLSETRAVGYRHEMGDVDQHQALADALKACAATVVLSGYHSTLYAGMYDGWNVVEMAASSGQANKGKAADARTEVLWSNRPLTVEDTLFGGAA